MTFDGYDSRKEALKTDGAIFIVTLTVLIPLAFLHELFLILSVLSGMYLTGAGLVHLVKLRSHPKDSEKLKDRPR